METRRLLTAVALLAVLGFAIWVTTPAPVTVPSVADWEECLKLDLDLPSDRSTVRKITPDVRPSQEAPPSLVARLREPGADFDPAILRGCLWLGDGEPQRVFLTAEKADEEGMANVEIDLPREPFAWFDWRRGRAATLAVATADGEHLWTGDFVYPSRFWAFVLATTLAGGLFIGLLYLRGAGAAWKTWLMGAFLGEDNQPSISLFQILLWTIITVWSLFFVFFSTGNLLTMTPQIMALLGFAGAGSLAARLVAAHRRSTPATGFKHAEKPHRFWAILENNGTLDLFKLQLFVFTLLIGSYVVFRVVRQSAFPELDAEFLLLMGVSNSLYVGSKVVPASPLDAARTVELERDILRLRVADLEAEVAKLEAEIDVLQQSIAQEGDAVKKQVLADRKSIIDSKLVSLRAELAQTRIDRDAKEKQYGDALKSLASS